jgi:hypothetical protein
MTAGKPQALSPIVKTQDAKIHLQVKAPSQLPQSAI